MRMTNRRQESLNLPDFVEEINYNEIERLEVRKDFFCVFVCASAKLHFHFVVKLFSLGCR